MINACAIPQNSDTYNTSRYVSSICYSISLLNARGLHRKYFDLREKEREREGGGREERTRKCLFVARNNIVLVIHEYIRVVVMRMFLLYTDGGGGGGGVCVSPFTPAPGKRMIRRVPPFWNAINKNSPDNVFESRTRVRFYFKANGNDPFFIRRRISSRDCIIARGEGKKNVCANIFRWSCLASLFIRVWFACLAFSRLCLPCLPRWI